MDWQSTTRTIHLYTKIFLNYRVLVCSKTWYIYFQKSRNMGECDLLFCGHSFIRRWKKSIEDIHGRQRDFSSILQLPGRIHIHGVGGLCLHSNALFSIIRANPCRFLVVDLGTNDLCSKNRYTTLEEHLQICKQRLSKLLTMASRQGVQRVKIVQVTDRFKFPETVSPEDWKLLRKGWNAHIYSLTGSNVDGMKISTWLHDRSSLKAMKQGVVSSDKLHPNLTKGMDLYHRSMVQSGRSITQDPC